MDTRPNLLDLLILITFLQNFAIFCQKGSFLKIKFMHKFWRGNALNLFSLETGYPRHAYVIAHLIFDFITFPSYFFHFFC